MSTTGARNWVARYQPGHRDGAETDQPDVPAMQPEGNDSSAVVASDSATRLPSVESATNSSTEGERPNIPPTAAPKGDAPRIRAAPQIVRGTRQSIAARKARWVASGELPVKVDSAPLSTLTPTRWPLVEKPWPAPRVRSALGAQQGGRSRRVLSLSQRSVLMYPHAS